MKPGSQEARKPGSQEARKPGSQEARKPGSQEARKPGSFCRPIASEREFNFKVAKSAKQGRCNLKPAYVQKLLFLKYNLRMLNVNSMFLPILHCSIIFS